MHILKIIHGYPPDYNAGSEVYSQSVCDQLSRQHTVSILTREENPYKPEFFIRKSEQPSGLTIYYINIPRGKDGYRHAKLDAAVSDLVSELRPDVAHIGHLNHLSTGIVDVLHERNIPIVFTLHDFWLMCPRGQFLQTNFGKNKFYQLCDGQEDGKCADKCYRALFTGSNEEEDFDYWKQWVHSRMKETRSIIDKVSLFIAPSNYLLSRFVNEFSVPKEKIIYLDYGFPTHYLRPVFQNKRDEFTFGYIGTHTHAKGVNILIESFNKVKGNVALKIWGRENGQSTKALKELAKECLNPVQFAGEYINKNLAGTVFSNTDCIVVPSIWMENSPLVIHEAQACKVPVITSDAGGMSEYVQHMKNGLLFQHRSVEDLADKMQYAYDNPDVMNRLGQTGYLYSSDGAVPAIEDHCKALVDLYQSVIQKKCQDTTSGVLQ